MTSLSKLIYENNKYQLGVDLLFFFRVQMANAAYE